MLTKRQARLAGREAYHAGERPECPYKRTGSLDSNRVAWYDGYYEARLADRLPKYFTLSPLGEC